jgi:hypothetical protein
VGADRCALAHFVEESALAGRSPHPFFDADCICAPTLTSGSRRSIRSFIISTAARQSCATRIRISRRAGIATPGPMRSRQMR